MKKITERNLNEALDFQISFLTDQNVRNGWTIKGLQVALVTLIWFVAQEMFGSKYDPTNILVFYVFLFVFFETVASFDQLIKGSRTANLWEYKSFLAPDSKIEYLILILKYIFIWIITECLETTVGFKFTAVLASAVVAKIIEQYFLFNLISFSPLKINQKLGKIDSAFNALLTAGNVWVIFGFLIFLFKKETVFSLPDFKIGGLFFLIMNVVVYLSKNQQSIFLESLKKLKFDLVFGRISLRDGIDRARLFIFGSNYSLLMQESVQNIFSAFDKYKNACDLHFDFFEKLITKSKAIKKMKPEDFKKFEKEYRKESKKISKKREKSLKKLNKYLDSFYSRSRKLLNYVDEQEPGEIKNIWKPIHDKLIENLKEIELKGKKMDKKTRHLISTI